MPHENHSTTLIRTDFLKTVVKQLVNRRKFLGLSQDEINFKIGVADRLVSKWECGTRTPNTFNLYCWADALESKIGIIPKEYGQSNKSIDISGPKAGNDNNAESINPSVPLK